MKTHDPETVRTWLAEALGNDVWEVVGTYEAAVADDLTPVTIHIMRTAERWMVSAVRKDGRRMTGQISDDLRTAILTAHWFELQLAPAE